MVVAIVLLFAALVFCIVGWATCGGGTYTIGKIVDKSNGTYRSTESPDIAYYHLHVTFYDSGTKKSEVLEVDHACFNSFEIGDSFGVKI